MTARYAIYWVPPAGSPLARLGEAWLGRSAEGAAVAARPAPDGFAAAALEAITAEPRRYGLHATLKPPFRLAPGHSVEALAKALAEFAARLAPVSAPALRLKRIARFLALMPGARDAALDAFAAASVAHFDGFRAPPEAAEIARRQRARLTAAQQANLARWGYPYVMGEFRFHVTLTGPIDSDVAARLEPFLGAFFAPAMAAPLEIRELALFREPAPGAAFELIERVAIGEDEKT
jgi:putative phosphonate metabolism protein